MEKLGKTSTCYDDEKLEEAQAQVDIWKKYVCGYVDMAVVKCAIELSIPDVLEQQQQQHGGGGGGGGSLTLSELSSALGCSSSAALHRIMRYLVHRGVFKEHFTSQGASLGYSQTPISRLLVKRNKETSMASLVLLESSPVMLAPWHNLSAHILGAAKDDEKKKSSSSPFESAHGKDLWSYAAMDAAHSKLINDAMACDARVAVRAAIDAFPELLNGVGSVVDVGGGDGTAMRMFAVAFPWIRGINYDLPHVVECSPPEDDRVVHVGGDMFDSVPKADAAFIMKVLHDWGDEECITILRNCREAIPHDVDDGKTAGKVIILEVVTEEAEEEEDHESVRLMLDMVMMAHTTTGKERNSREWAHILTKAGFSRYTTERIKATPYFVIQAYP